MPVTAPDPPAIEQTQADSTQSKAADVVIPKWEDMSISSSIPSLDAVFDTPDSKDTDTPEYLQGTAKNAFSEAAFLQQWKAFAAEAKASGSISLYTLMTQHAPVLKEDYSVEVQVENGVQERLLAETKIDILNHLRKNLNNFSINLIPHMPKQAGKHKPVTNMERYQHMKQKNPVLDDLRKQFNLDFD